jgi:hypothetical protein
MKTTDFTLFFFSVFIKYFIRHNFIHIIADRQEKLVPAINKDELQQRLFPHIVSFDLFGL